MKSSMYSKNSNHLIPSMISVLYSYILSIKGYTTCTRQIKMSYECSVIDLVTILSFKAVRFLAFQ